MIFQGTEEHLMKKLGVMAALSIALVVALIGAVTAEAATLPPKNLKLVGDHFCTT